METFKSNTAFDLIKMGDVMYENRKQLFFLLDLQIIPTQKTTDLFCKLHQWPSKLNEAMRIADASHELSKNKIGSALQK